MSFAWMKFLESTPERYDRGVRMLSAGRIQEVYERIATLAASPGKKILDIGCGTGGVSLACAARSAVVTGIDISAGMLEVARKKPVPSGGSVEFIELSVAEIPDRFSPNSLDAVVSCLAMSELSPDEQAFALRVAYASLEPGGVIVIADETVPKSPFGRLAWWLRRIPVAAATYALTQTTTRPLSSIRPQLETAGFTNIREESMWSGSFLIVWSEKR